MDKPIFYTSLDGQFVPKLIKKMIDRNVYFSVDPKENGIYEIGIDAQHEEWIVKTISKLGG